MESRSRTQGPYPAEDDGFRRGDAFRLNDEWSAVMAFPGNDEYDDRTLGAPPGAPKSSESTPNARRNPPPPLRNDLPPIRPKADKPSRPESRPSGGGDDYLGTLLPPTPPASRPSPQRPPTPPPQATPPIAPPSKPASERPGSPRPPVPEPENLVTAWPSAPAQTPPPGNGSNFDPGWGFPSESTDLGTALGPPSESNPSGLPPSGFDPWTQFGGREPVTRQDPAPPPRPASVPENQDTPPAGYAPPNAHSSPELPPSVHRPPPTSIDDDACQTIGIGRGRLPVTAVGKMLFLQVFDGFSQWCDLEPIRPEGLVVGRDMMGQSLEFLAVQHLRFTREGLNLFVEPLRSINGVYLRLLPSRPVELRAGSRFLVGKHVIEFQPASLVETPENLVASDGEVFRSRALVPLAFLDFIGPDNRVSLRFPITKLEHTILGREGDDCDIGLTGDDWTSRRRHARLLLRDGGFLLEDLHSTNGTYLQLTGRTPFRPGQGNNPEAGDILLIGDILFRVVEK